VPEAYTAEFTSQEAIDEVAEAANRTMVLVSGGSRAGDEAMLDKAHMTVIWLIVWLIQGTPEVASWPDQAASVHRHAIAGQGRVAHLTE
jgi:hypothetical protein